MSWTELPLRRVFSLVTGGSWGVEPDAGDICLPCIRGTDFDYPALRTNPFRAPIRGYSSEEVCRRAAARSDLIIEKSGGGEQQPVGRVVLHDLNDPVMPTNFAGRLRVQPSVDPRFACYLLASMYSDGLTRAVIKQTTGIQNLDLDALLSARVRLPSQSSQIAIADYLDAETARIDSLIEKKRRMVELLEERVDHRIRARIAASLVEGTSGTILIKRALQKLERLPLGVEMVTAYRDGQVTARSSRRAEGYTESWTDAARLQGVQEGDVVVHGLDGFAGAVGTSEVDGVCSPVYHVCSPRDGGDPVYLGRLLRLLAVSNYLGLFASSTRERAVDFRNWDLFGRIPIPDVPVIEQREIASVIRGIIPLKSAVERSATLAREYRNALVTAVITGQLAIPGVAA